MKSDESPNIRRKERRLEVNKVKERRMEVNKVEEGSECVREGRREGR